MGMSGFGIFDEKSWDITSEDSAEETGRAVWP